MRFQDRREAGRRLATTLQRFRGRRDAIVLGLAREGLPVADEVAMRLDLPLDVFIVNKVGVPGRPELSLGAVASGGVRVLDEAIVDALALEQDALEAAIDEQMHEVWRREQAYHAGRCSLELAGKVVILVDDGIATGASMRAAIKAVRARGARTVVVAVPVADCHACAEVSAAADELVCLGNPDPVVATDGWYAEPETTSDDDVTALLESAWVRDAPSHRRAG